MLFGISNKRLKDENYQYIQKKFEGGSSQESVSLFEKAF
jgi:hypothetical protein